MAKNIWSNVVDLGFKGKYSKAGFEKLAGLVRSAIGLPYVPLEMIRNGDAMNVLKKIAKELKGKQRKFANDFVKYVEKVWIKGNYSLESWNFYNHRGITTNNHHEGYNYRIGQRKGLPSRPNPYLLIGVIRDELKKGTLCLNYNSFIIHSIIIIQRYLL